MKLIMENWRRYQERDKLLSDPVYISKVLGIEVPLNESYPYSSVLTEQILSEHLLLEGWIDSVKNFVKDKAGPYKDFLVTFTEIIQDPKRLDSFLFIVNKNMKRTMVPLIYKGLELIRFSGVPDFSEMFKKTLENYGGLSNSWKKALVGSAMYVAFAKIKDFLSKINIDSIMGEIKDKGAQEIKDILAELPIFEKLKQFIVTKAKDLIGPELLTKAASMAGDVKNYLGWLGPIVGGVDVVVKALSPMTSKMQGVKI